MQMDTQKYSNSTVYIVIAFLAIFIIMPPLCRVFYKEGESVADDTPAQEVALADGKLICTKTYSKTGMEITSTATYEGGSIVTNVISIKNPLLSDDGLDEEGAKEFSEYQSMFSGLLTVPAANQAIAGTTVTVTLNQDVVDSLEDSQSLSSQLTDSLTLQNSYEVNGYNCTTE